MNVIFGI